MKEEYRPLFPVGLLFIVVSKTNENVCFLHKQHLTFPKDLMFSRSVLWTGKWGDLCKGLDPYLGPPALTIMCCLVALIQSTLSIASENAGLSILIK